jgi:hypothetical protein
MKAAHTLEQPFTGLLNFFRRHRLLLKKAAYGKKEVRIRVSNDSPTWLMRLLEEGFKLFQRESFRWPKNRHERAKAWR